MFRRNHRKSDTDLRGRRSLDAIRALAHARSSEQIHRQHRGTGRPSTPERAQSPDNRSASVRSKPSPRFSLLRFRNASDPALGLRAKDPNPPPLPTNHPIAPPAIITTSPTNDITDATTATTSEPPMKRSGTMRLWRSKTSDRESEKSAASLPATAPSSQRSSLSTKRLRDAGSSRNNSSMRLSRVTFDEPERPSITEPPPYDEQNSSLPIPPPRLSESSRSTASSGEHAIGYSTTTTTHTTTTTTFFRLPRRKRKDASLFPLPSKSIDNGTSTSDPELTPQAQERRHSMVSDRSATGSALKAEHDVSDRHVSTMLAASSLNFTGPGGGVPMLRSNSMASAQSAGSAPSSPQRHLSMRRGRSSTMSSLDQGNKSISKSGFGGLLGRIRRDSEPMFGQISGSSSPQPIMALSAPGSSGASRDVFIPERHDEDTPPVYLSKLLDAVSKSVVASLLARSGDTFHLAVLTVYMETFDFESDPMDMALRKLLMEVELPSETQQIDRVLQAFADRYHHCNPFIYKDSDQAYFIAFSLIMLHTDFYNKNNKHKMQKADYVKNTSTSEEGISHDILECFYANITYTPFIRMEDEYDINGEKIVPHRPKKGLFHRTINAYDGRRMKEPIDPYLLIIDHQLDLLRSSLKDVIQFEDPYTYSGTASRLDMAALHKAVFRSGLLQIVSPRSRPDAFMTQATVDDPDGANPGVVEVKVTKVGILWRKDLKKKKTRSPWQEWGAILTGSQLYFFRSVGWIKSLMTQYEQHHKTSPGTPVTFKPALEQFKPDAQISTDDAVALLDTSYKKHKNAFAFIRHGGVQEFFLAESEPEMNDWLAKLNYAATFRTAGVRMRGVVGGNYDGQRSRGIRRMDSSSSSTPSNSVQTPGGEVSIVRGGIDAKLLAEISAARRDIVEKRIFSSEESIAKANRELQTHLRNGRHLTILTPIQPRTREQVMMAAATLAAKLRWIRMEMWKLRCHRDILALDMEEERKSLRDFDKRVAATASGTAMRISPVPTAQPSPIPGGSIGGSIGEPTPTQANFTPSPPSDGISIRPTRSHRTVPSADFASSPVSERPARDFSSSARMRSRSAGSRGRLSIAATDSKSIDTHSHRSLTPSYSESSFNVSIEQDKENEGETDEKKEKKKDKGKDKERDSSRPNIRKSLQRTLRETNIPGHKRNKSGDEQAADKKPVLEEGLPRVSGHFTVHGKKASVITFGSEWQSMLPEERLRRNKNGSESEANGADNESLSSLMMNPSRRGSQTIPHLKTGDDNLGVNHNISRRGSHATTATEELPEVPEGAMLDDLLIARLTGFAPSPSPAATPPPDFNPADIKPPASTENIPAVAP